jgi:hypothetical protein
MVTIRPHRNSVISVFADAGAIAPPEGDTILMLLPCAAEENAKVIL